MARGDEAEIEREREREDVCGVNEGGVRKRG